MWLQNYFSNYVRKLIARRWIYEETYPLETWKKMVNGALPLYKMTYEACGSPQKIRKVWFRWMDFMDTLVDESEV